MKQLKRIQVPKQSLMLDKFSSEKSLYSDRNFFLNHYRTINRLLRVEYSYYYKYSFNIFVFLKKLIALNTWRFYLKPLNSFLIFSPYFKFFPQINIKDSIFNNLLVDQSIYKRLLFLNNRFFTTSSYLKLYTKSFRRKLPGGLNTVFIFKDRHRLISDLDISSLKHMIIEKKTIKNVNDYCMSTLFYSLNFIFYICLSNYVALYNQIFLSILIRL